MGALIDVDNIQVARLILEVASRRNNQWTRSWAQGHRVVTTGLLDVKEQLIAKNVDEVNPHQLTAAGHTGAEKILIIEGIRILVFRVDLLKIVKAIYVRSGAFFSYQVNDAGRPGTNDRSPAINTQSSVDDSKGTPGPVMAGAEN
jgi:hypothetical protein